MSSSLSSTRHCLFTESREIVATRSSPTCSTCRSPGSLQDVYWIGCDALVAGGPSESGRETDALHTGAGDVVAVDDGVVEGAMTRYYSSACLQQLCGGACDVVRIDWDYRCFRPAPDRHLCRWASVGWIQLSSSDGRTQNWVANGFGGAWNVGRSGWTCSDSRQPKATSKLYWVNKRFFVRNIKLY